MNVQGIGIVFSGGFGMASLEQAMRSGWQMPREAESPRFPGVKRPAYTVDLAAAPDRSLLRKIRRADDLSKMAVLSAADALEDGGISNIRDRKLGIIVATGFGAHVTTFSFLDDILDYGDAAVSPTTFSNSVHNAAASYVSSALEIRGPTLTVTQFRFSFQAALQVADCWLELGRCDHVLVGGVDQYGDVLAHVVGQRLETAADGKVKPFLFNTARCVPGEGAVFVLLGKGQGGRDYCAVKTVRTHERAAPSKAEDVTIIDADGMMSDESVYRTVLTTDSPVAAYAPLVGSMMVGSAFNMAAGALMLKQQMLYATPVQDNPSGVRLVEKTEQKSISNVRCVGFDCDGQCAEIVLARS